MKSLSIVSFFIMIVLSACHKSDFGTEQLFTISGKIINYNLEKDPKTIQVIRRDFFDLNEKNVDNINEDGTFKLEFPISYIQEIYLEYGNLISLLCIPGDSMYIEIDNKILYHPLSSLNFLKFPKNKIGETNRLISKFKEEVPDDGYTYENAFQAEKDKSPEEYVVYIKNRTQDYESFLKKFNEENRTTELFDRWADDHIRYSTWNALMRYRWTHPHYANMDNFKVPEDYFSFLNNYDMNDNALFSIAHADFLDEFFTYSNQNPVDSVARAMKIYQTEGPVKAMGILKDMIALNSMGFTRELFYTKFYVGILEAKELNLFEAVYDSCFTAQPYFLNTIDTEYKKLKDYVLNQNTYNANISKIESSIVADLLDVISDKYRDKVIYIDFWAPWCEPCMNEMPHSNQVQEYFKNRDVVFLFLAGRCEENSWRATIANTNLPGEHILLTDDQFNVLSGILDITGIPHYALIDKNGNIVLKNAPRPSEKDRLIKEIEKLLN